MTNSLNSTLRFCTIWEEEEEDIHDIPPFNTGLHVLIDVALYTYADVPAYVYMDYFRDLHYTRYHEY